MKKFSKLIALVLVLSLVFAFTACGKGGSDDTIKLTPPRVFSLEEALEFINDDELVEVTPDDIRLRKKYLNELERRRANR